MWAEVKCETKIVAPNVLWEVKVMAADPSLDMWFPGLKMRNYAASATCLRQTTLFADTHVLAFIASQWAMFDIFICDEKNNQYLHLVWNRTHHQPAWGTWK